MNRYTYKDVYNMLERRYVDKEPLKDIAASYGVHPGSLRAIVAGTRHTGVFEQFKLDYPGATVPKGDSRLKLTQKEKEEIAEIVVRMLEERYPQEGDA